MLKTIELFHIWNLHEKRLLIAPATLPDDGAASAFFPRVEGLEREQDTVVRGVGRRKCSSILPSPHFPRGLHHPGVVNFRGWEGYEMHSS